MKPLDIDAVCRALPARPVLYFESLDSTMFEAGRQAAAGCPSGLVVVAEEQTAGQGRHGRIWHSEAGSGLYCSIVLRLSLPPDSLPALTLALGLATADAISRSTELAPDIRWPNDIMIGGRKAGGILVQLLDSTPIAGIGINVNHAAFPEDLAELATSLRLQSGRVHSREDLLLCLLEAVDSYARMLVKGGPAPVLEAFARHSSYARGKRVRVEQAGGPVEGVTAGLDPHGYLVVRRDDGSETTILAGGVRAVGS